MNFDEACSYLLSLGHETLTIKLGLENTQTLLRALGSPHKKFPSVQIAGTNGKGSTAVMLDSICRAAGIRTALFTSPHLISITERISIDGEQVSEADFARLTTQAKAAAEGLISEARLETLPTFFEHVTAVALLAFCEANVEVAILETGLGGRLDSTTAAEADIVAITPVAMDHEEYLGHSLAEIAAEKAAIIRSGVPAIIAPQLPEVLEVIHRQCRDSAVIPTLIQDSCNRLRPGGDSQTIIDATADGCFRVTFQTKRDQYESVQLSLRGRHQVANAAVAIALAEALRERGFPVSREAIVNGIETTKHAGRLELWPGKAPILFDGAHNAAAAQALRDYLDEFIKQPITMVFGAMRDKDLNKMGALLFPAADKLILTEFDNPRAATIDRLKLALPVDLDQAQVRYSFSADDALRVARELTPANGLICVTGSLYLVGNLQQIMRSASQNFAHHHA